MLCKTLKSPLVQERPEVVLWRRAGLVGAGRFILLRTTRLACSDQVGHSLTLTQPASLTPHSLTSLVFLLLTSYSYNVYLQTISGKKNQTDLLLVWLSGFNEIKRAKKLIRYWDPDIYNCKYITDKLTWNDTEEHIVSTVLQYKQPMQFKRTSLHRYFFFTKILGKSSLRSIEIFSTFIPTWYLKIIHPGEKWWFPARDT